MQMGNRNSARAGTADSPLRLLLLFLLVLLSPGAAWAQAIAVLPVNIRLDSGQSATALTIFNKADAATSYQVRGFSWSQPGGSDQTDPTDGLMISPPLGTIAPNATQVVRLVLRKPAESQEESYRVFVDQIPPPAASGTVRIALRMSIPVFAEPATHVAPHVRWHVERGAQDSVLVAVNDGSCHETIHKLSLTMPDGTPVKIENHASPYILRGATRQWHILLPGSPAPGTLLHLSVEGDADSDSVDEQIPLGGNS